MKPRSRERGMTIPMMALFIVTLFAMAALAVDLGVLYTARTSAQHAADAAALAGAFTFMTPGAPQPETATAAAIAAGNKNSILGTTVQLTAANVNVEVANRRVTVTVPRTGANGVETMFAKAIGWSKVDVQVSAMAEAAQKGTGTSCLKPLYIPNTIASTLAPGAACGARQVLFDSQGNLTAWAQQNFNPNDVKGLTPIQPQDTLASSQFYALDFGSGGNTYRCTIGHCLSECGVDLDAVRCGDTFDVETGRMIGPTAQGVDDLTGNPADTWGGQHSGIWSYHPNGDTSIWSDTSRSLGVAPVWDNCAQTIRPGTNNSVKILGFLEIFVVGMHGSEMQAHLVQPISCSTAGGAGGGGGATGSNTGPYGVPVRLVNQAKND